MSKYQVEKIIELEALVSDLRAKNERYEDALRQAKNYIEAACDFNQNWFELSGTWIAISNALEEEL